MTEKDNREKDANNAAKQDAAPDAGAKSDGQAKSEPNGERAGQTVDQADGGKKEEGDGKDEHIKLNDLSVEELRNFVMFQKQINDALVKENEQLIKEKQDLARVIANSDKYLDQLVALKNDFNSYKERIRCDADRSRDEGRISAIEKILPLLDTLEKARVDIKDGKAFELIYRQFAKCLFEIGIEEIDITGQPFDPAVANALSERETDEENKGKVVEVYQKGYRYKDRILRYAQVIVGK